MKINIAHTLVFFLFSIAIIIQFNSCYTAVKNGERKETERNPPSADSLSQGTCIIEGVVHNFAQEVPDQETQREIQMNPNKIYFLDNYFWVSGAPAYSIRYIFLEGVDETYENKYVRIEGIIQNAPSGYYVNIQTPLNIRVYASKIEIIR